MSVTSYNQEDNGNMTSTVEHNNNTAWYEHSDKITITTMTTDVITMAQLHNYGRDITMMQPWWWCNDK